MEWYECLFRCISSYYQYDHSLKGVTVEGNENAFFDFIETQVNEMQEATRLGTDKEISFFELEKALKGYSSVYLSLLSLYNMARIDVQKEDESFNTWYSGKYVEVRAEVNKPELTAQKWASTKEIEHMVRSLNGLEYMAKKKALSEKELRVSFLKDLIEMWKAHQFILSTLSSNIRTEAGMNQ